MGFFDLFKRKKTEPKVEEPKIEQPAVEVAEVAPCEPEPVQECVPEERVADNASQEVVAEVPAEQVVVEEPKIVEEKPQEVTVEEDDDDEPNIEEERKELEAGLEKTKEGFFGRLKRAIAGRTTVDADVLDDLEEMLITSDVGVETTVKIIEAIEARVARDKYMNTSELNDILREEIAYLMEESHRSTRDFGIEVKEGFPYVMMVVGVNGAGKTTTIGKLAAKLTRAGRKVYIGAADTFRAAAIDQLAVWAERAGATMVRQDMGSDPASVAYDTLRSAVANGADVVLIDTAGRLHNKVGLMKELTKIRNVMSKVIPDAPHEVMLVLDGSTGQNAFEQAKQFTEATQVTSLTITKLDGTAKGGVVIGISDKFHIPVRYIGIGEGIDQLKMFDRKEFVRALFGDAKN
jgi:fused signal recognition particle receptor